MRIYYKVLRESYDNLYSCSSSHSPHTVLYRPNKWSKAPEKLAAIDYYLLVFSKLKDAKFFISRNYAGTKIKIYRCEIKKGKSKDLPYRLVWESVRQICQSTNGPKDKHMYLWPDGTVMAKEVKILTEVTK